MPPACQGVGRAASALHTRFLQCFFYKTPPDIQRSMHSASVQESPERGWTATAAWRVRLLGAVQADRGSHQIQRPFNVSLLVQPAWAVI